MSDLPAGAWIDSQHPAPTSEVLFEHDLLQHRRLFAEIEALRPPICAAGSTMARAIRRGGRLLFFGSDGTLSDCRRLAAAFCSRLSPGRTRPPVALAFSSEGKAQLASSNVGIVEAEMFAQQMTARARADDCAIAVCAGAESAQVLSSLLAARAMGLATIGLLGHGGHDGRARGLVDTAVIVDHPEPVRVEEAHLFIGHFWCRLVEAALQRS